MLKSPLIQEQGVRCLGYLVGYECNHQQNLKTVRGAKSNALFLRRANWNRICPCVALVIRAAFGTVSLSTPAPASVSAGA